MADGAVQLPPDSTGTRLRTVTNAGVAGGAHQEVVTLAAPDGTLSTPATQETLEAVRALLTATFTVAGTLTDPTAVTLRVKAPNGVTTTVANTRSSVGVFRAEVPITQAGTWAYRWLGTGAAAAAEEGKFLVRAQAVV